MGMGKKLPYVPTEEHADRAIYALERAINSEDAGLEPYARAVCDLIREVRQQRAIAERWEARCLKAERALRKQYGFSAELSA